VSGHRVVIGLLEVPVHHLVLGALAHHLVHTVHIAHVVHIVHILWTAACGLLCGRLNLHRASLSLGLPELHRCRPQGLLLNLISPVVLSWTSSNSGKNPLLGCYIEARLKDDDQWETEVKIYGDPIQSPTGAANLATLLVMDGQARLLQQPRQTMNLAR
jgi:hypothetical protein